MSFTKTIVSGIIGVVPRHHRGALAMQINRRQFLQAGAIPLLGLSLPRYLENPNNAHSKKSVILFYLLGGPSQLDTYDPKPDAPVEIRGSYQAISTNVPGIVISETMPEQAKIADQMIFVRSFNHSDPDHGSAQLFAVSGHDTENSGQFYPSVGSVFSKLRDDQEKGGIGLPYVFMANRNSIYPHGRGNLQIVGGKYQPKLVRDDPNKDDFKVDDLELLSEVTPERLASRRQILKSLDNLKLESERRVEESDIFQQRAFDLLTSNKIANAFDINDENDGLRDRYGRTEIGQRSLLARRLIEAGACFISIEYVPPEKNNYGWDHHVDLSHWMPGAAFPFDQAIAALITDLKERGMLDDVLVLAFGEFGRTPKINNYGGRDHWPRAGSIVMAGGGLVGGQVYGGTDRYSMDINKNPVHPGDLLATVYKTIGHHPNDRLYDRNNRPVFLAEGRPIF